jgi:hypothetical protein
MMGNYQTKAHTTATKGGSPMCVYAKDLGLCGSFVTLWMDAPPYLNISDIEQ